MKTNINFDPENTHIGKIFNLTEERTEEIGSKMEEALEIQSKRYNNDPEGLLTLSIIEDLVAFAETEDELHYAIFMAGMKVQVMETKTRKNDRLRSLLGLFSASI